MKCKKLTALGLISGIIVSFLGEVSFASAREVKNSEKVEQNSDQRTEAEKIRDELFKCHVANKFYDRIHHQILRSMNLREVRSLSLALCSTKCMNSEEKSDREMFMKSVIVVMNWVNERIREQRKFILMVRDKQKNHIALSDVEQKMFDMICSFYQSKKVEDLLIRVAPIPLSLAVSQAALESGFGSNPKIHRNNAFFGMMRDAKSLCSFDTMLESVIAYSKSLNVHGAYRNFRRQRAKMMAASQKIDGEKLSQYLGWYSENPSYRRLIKQLMKEYNLQAFDMVV